MCRACLNARFDQAYDWSHSSPADFIYLAGMVDGEGHIGLAPTSSSWVPILVVTNTDEGLMDWLVSRFAGAVHRHARADGRHKPRFNWRLTGRHATDMLERLRPYLVIKARQAELAVSFYTPEGSFHDGARRLPQHELERRRLLHAELKALNKRGTTITN